MFHQRSIRHLAWLTAVAMTLLSGTTALAQQLRQEARQAIERLIDREGPSEYWIGIECAMVPGALAAQLDLDADHGLLVADVVSGSPAAAAGLEKHDVLLEVDETPLADLDRLHESVEQAGKDGDALKLGLLRKGQPLTIEVKPQSRPSGVMPGRRDRGDDELGRIRELMGRDFVWPEDGPIIGFRPGMILPPGGDLGSKLPENMNIEVHKQGAKSAEITVRRGDESWHVTQDELDKLPADIRRHVEPMLGWGIRGPQQMSSIFRNRTERPGGLPRETEHPRGPEQLAEPRPESDDGDSRYEQLDQRIDRLHQAVRRLEELLRRNRSRGDESGSAEPASEEPSAALEAPR